MHPLDRDGKLVAVANLLSRDKSMRNQRRNGGIEIRFLFDIHAIIIIYIHVSIHPGAS